eukprot:48162_1
MLFLYCTITVYLFVFGTNASPKLDLIINKAQSNGNNFYSINVNGTEWLQSGQFEGYFNNQWYTSNETKSQNDMDYELMKMISSSTQYDRFDDFGGGFTYQIYEWQAGTAIFQTNFKIYNDGRSISFVQSFPNGVKGTAFSETKPNSGGDPNNGPNIVPFLTFPSFNIVNKSSKYASSNLGYLTWTHTMSTAKWGKAPVSSSNLAGLSGGPICLYDHSGNNAIVVSTNDHFAVSTQANAMQGSLAQAMYMYDKDRNDSVTCLGSRCYESNPQYTDRIIQGVGSINNNNNNNELIPLTLWYSYEFEDNYVSTSTTPPDSSYNNTFNNGYIFKNNDVENSRLTLDLYYNQDKHDHATIASAWLKKQLMQNGYKFVATQGYIQNMTSPMDVNNDWRLGISSQVLEIPQGFEHETVIVVGKGINDAMLNGWSNRLKSLYHTVRVENENDIITSYLGYWTDNGAYYYGDSWGATGNPMNLTCCSLAVFSDVKANLDKQKIPIKYWQMDDWWYYGLHPKEYINGPYWSGVKSVKHWDAPPAYYPGGIATLSKQLQVPLLLYGPYFSPDNDWINDFSFIPEGAGFVLPSPEDSYGFYSALFDFGINASTTGPNTGMVGYEIDFMSSLSGIPQFRTHINQQQIWLDGMNKAAEERGIPIQYCMATPMDLMQSLSLGQVTNGRASGDYAGSDNYNIGPGALLWSALDLKPSKDNFWTSLNEGPPHYHPSGSDDHNSTEVHAMIAVFSCGPVGISDRSGWSNATLIMRLCNAEGRLLQPSRPITAMDDQFIY